MPLSRHYLLIEIGNCPGCSVLSRRFSCLVATLVSTQVGVASRELPEPGLTGYSPFTPGYPKRSCTPLPEYRKSRLSSAHRLAQSRPRGSFPTSHKRGRGGERGLQPEVSQKLGSLLTRPCALAQGVVKKREGMGDFPKAVPGRSHRPRKKPRLAHLFALTFVTAQSGGA